MVFITILYDLGLEMSTETRVKVSWSTPFTSGHLGFELPIYAHSNRQPIKKRLMFLLGYGPIAIADWSIIVQCHLLVKHGF
jgi:hypothetical protein